LQPCGRVEVWKTFLLAGQATKGHKL
jgi:hypothetical protein